ncbi:MAG: hypothetical protein ABSA74_00310 [Candidatus Staskawiczbacteria bacterium]|jgi:hypothetical protein
MQTANFPINEFNETKRLNPRWSDYICFAETIKGRKSLSTKTIKRYFDICVDKEDYAKSEKPAVLKYLIDLSEGVSK